MSAQFKDATNDAVQFLTKHGDLTRAAAYDAIRLLTGNGFVVTRTDLLPSATDLPQAAVAAALEAAAGVADECEVTLPLGIGLADGASMSKRQVAAAIRDLITPAQHDALAAHVAAEVAKARAEDADLLYNAWLGLRVLENIAKVKGLSGAADVTTPLLAEIEAAHPEFAPRSALRAQIGAKL